jgi:hypothetical protein
LPGGRVLRFLSGIDFLDHGGSVLSQVKYANETSLEIKLLSDESIGEGVTET